MVCYHLPAHCFLQVVERRRELGVAAGSNYQRFNRMLSEAAGIMGDPGASEPVFLSAP
jgi:hypothetical protein